MAQITINIPDGVVQRVLDAVAFRFQWDPTSGQNKAQFAKGVIIKLLKDAVKSHEGNLAVQQATEAANAAVDAEINLT